MIPAYSPQALRLRGIRTVERANRSLREHYIRGFNRRFQVPAAQRGTAFIACPRRDLELIFSLQFERAGEPRQHGQLPKPGSAD